MKTHLMLQTPSDISIFLSALYGSSAQASHVYIKMQFHCYQTSYTGGIMVKQVDIQGNFRENRAG